MTPDAAPGTPLDLSALRGLHLPTGGGGAVQAELAAAIALGFAAALLVGLIRVIRTRRSATVRRAALRELTLTQGLPPEARRVAQAQLLRRVVRTLEGEAAAGARGLTWASTLDRTFATELFSRGPGRVLVDGLYRRPDATDPAALDAELGRLFARIRA